MKIVKPRVALILMCFFALNVSAIDLSSASQDTSCPAFDNTFECARSLESHLILNEPSILSRNQDGLLIKSSDKEKYELKNITGGDEENYVAVDVSSDKRFISIFIQYFEGSSWGIFDRRANALIPVCGFPIYSPNKHYIAFAEVDLYSDMSPTCLDIYDIKKESIVKVFSADVSDWGPAAPKWISAKSLQFSRQTWNPGRGDAGAPEFLMVEQVVSLNGKTWGISESRRE